MNAITTSGGSLPRASWAAVRRYGYAALAYTLLVALLAISWSLEHQFFALNALADTLAGAAPVTILSIAVTVPILAGNGGIDLSIGPLVSLINVSIVTLAADGHIPSAPYAVIPVALTIGVASGLVNGFLVAVMRIQPIVATLGTYLAYAAFAAMILPQTGKTAPDWMSQFAATIGPLPGAVFPILAIAVAWLAITRTPFYRYLYSTGDSEATAFSSGVPVTAVKTLAYVLCGLFTAVGALAMTALIGSGDATIGTPLTLTAIAGAALGGTTLAGGRGGVLGAVAGGLAVYLIQNVLTITHVPAFYVTLTYGPCSSPASPSTAALPFCSGGPGHERPRRDDQTDWIRLSASQASMLTAWLATVGLFVTGSVTITGFSSLPSVKSLLVLGSDTRHRLRRPNARDRPRRDRPLDRCPDDADRRDDPPVDIAGMEHRERDGGHDRALRRDRGNERTRLPVTPRSPVADHARSQFHRHRRPARLDGGAPEGSSPAWLTTMVSPARTLGPIPVPPVTAVWAGIAIVMLVLMNRTAFGRRVYALGSSPSAAEHALVRPVWTWTIVFTLSGLMASIAGLMLSGFTGYGDVNSGDPYLFDTIAAVVIGGTSLLGGRGGYFRTIAGSIAYIEIQTLLIGYGIGPNPQQVALGVIIVGLAVLYGRESHIRLRI